MKDLFERRLLESLHREERVDKPIDFYEFLRELADAFDNGDVKLIEGD